MNLDPHGVGQRWYQRGALFPAIVLAALLLASCDPLGGGADTIPGTPLPGTAGVDCTRDHSILVSPNADWAVFWFAADEDDSHHALATPRNRLALIDLRSWKVYVPPHQPPPNPEYLWYPGLEDLCWRTGPEPGFMVHGVTTQRWYRVDFERPERLQQMAREPDATNEGNFVMYAPARQDPAKNAAAPGSRSGLGCQPPQSHRWKAWVRSTHRPEITRGLHVERSQTFDSVSLVTKDGRRLAHYEVPGFLDYIVSVSTYTWSPHGQWLAYSVGAMWGSFAKRNHTFVVARDGRTRLPLEGNVRLTWVSDDLFLGCVGPSGYNSESSVQYWRLPAITGQ